MAVCANRTDTPGFFTSCAEASGWHGCTCGKEVEAESATTTTEETSA